MHPTRSSISPLQSSSTASTHAPPTGDGQVVPPTPLSLSHILDATAACLAESGYDGTTIRRIAGRLNCAVGSIYRYCRDKRALLSAVTQRRFEPVAQAVEDHVSIGRTARDYAAIVADDPQQYRLMFWLASMGAGPRSDAHALPPVVRRIIDGWSRQVGDPRLAQRLWAQLHGEAMLALPVEMIGANIDAQLEGRAIRTRTPTPTGDAAPSSAEPMRL